MADDDPENHMKITNTRISLFDAFLVAAFFVLIGWHFRVNDAKAAVRPVTRPVTKPPVKTSTSETLPNGVSSRTEAALNKAGYTGRRLVSFNIKEKTKKE